MNIGTRIKRIRKELGLTVDQLAERIGKDRATIYRYENGEIENMPTTVIEPLAKALLTTPQYLMGWDEGTVTENQIVEARNYLFNIAGFRSDDDIIEMLNDKELVDFANSHKSRRSSIKNFVADIYEGIEVISSVYKIPLYDVISCGSGLFVNDNIVDLIALPDSLVDSNKEYFCQYAVGDSMINENIHEGDLLVFEKTAIIENGQIGCFCIDENMATCKKFYKDDASAIITLQPANPKYAPIIVTIENMNFHVVGKLSLVINKRD